MLGGFGMKLGQTALVRIQTKKLPPGPIILVGIAFWSGLTHWINQQLLANGLIDAADPHVFTVVDSPEEAVAHIQRFYKAHLNAIAQRGSLPV